MIHIGLDAMGGDNAPSAVVEGAILAAKAAKGAFRIVLTGPEDTVQAELKKFGYSEPDILVHHAPDLVGMDESPANVLKTKQNSGLVTCVGLQKAGKVQASMSAGNSGAMMAACLMILGRAGTISRPAIACVIPTSGQPAVLVDCGANVDEKASTLMHFGICGSIYAEQVLEYTSPRVGLLNLGEEEKKGPEVLQEAYQLLKNAPLNFIGNIEGRDILRGAAEVIVAPGYAGNIVLKLMEGFYEYHMNLFGTLDSEPGRRFAHDWDYSNYGAALLLGLNGTGVITHGRANAKAIKNGLETAFKLAGTNVAEKVAAKLTQAG